MKKYFLYIPLFAACLIIIGCGAAKSLTELSDEASELHKEMLTIDTHTDTPLRLLYDNFDISKKHDSITDDSKLDFPRMKSGGLDAAFFAAYIAQGPRTSEGNEKAKERIMRLIDTIKTVIQKNSTLSSLALSSADAYRIKSDNKAAIYIGIENGYAIGNDPSLIKKYYDLGVRYITLCHTKNNDICDSSTDPDSVKHNGLSDFGKRVVDEMNKTGMIIDISHVSDKTFLDVIKLSKVPVIASHSCARSICNSPRNLSDSLLKKLADNGGVIQICILSDYVKTFSGNLKRDSAFAVFRAKYPKSDTLTSEIQLLIAKEKAELEKLYPRILATVSDVVDHIDHIVNVAGIDHVGIGTDFDGGGEVTGCFDVSEMKNITIELLKRGYSKNDIRKIWGENFMRVFRKVEEFAGKNNGNI
ncbi:MAG: dipeptidase [Ignavibacteriales bacterium]|nr:dipeptidase [Ignavibacteriales bacterium]